MISTLIVTHFPGGLVAIAVVCVVALAWALILEMEKPRK